MGTQNNDQIDDDLGTGDDDNQEVNNFLDMSDEDMAKLNTPSMAAAPADKPAADAGNEEETDEEKAATAAAAAALDSDDVDVTAGNPAGKGAGDEDSGKSEADKAADVASRAADAASAADKAAAGTDGKAADDKAAAADGKKEEVKDEGDGKAKSGVEDAKDESGAIDYKAAYERLTAPFKANGRDITVKSVDDAIQLMQMGANYNKKMAGLKPSLKLVKMLEGAGLMDESQLGFLIDLHKGDTNAINKLILDRKMDPLDLSAAKASEYKPGNHTVDDQSMELDEVLADIKGSEHYARTLDVVANQWDKSSKSEVAENPQVIRLINDHISVGIFDIVAAEIESERTFGRLKGLSDLQAYQKVGDAINARGGFNHLTPGSSQSKKETKATAPVIVPPKPKQVEDDKLKDKRRQASGTKAAAPAGNSVPADFNPLAMSDDDMKQFKF
jgi:hypothetical protein